MIKNLGEKANSNGFNKRPEDAKKGGAKKGKRVKTVLAELLNNPSKKLKDLIPDDLEPTEAIALELLSIAFSKDVNTNVKLNAIKVIMDRIDGKPIQSINQRISTNSYNIPLVEDREDIPDIGNRKPRVFSEKELN